MRAVYRPRLVPELGAGALQALARTVTAVSSVILLVSPQLPLLPVRALVEIDAGRLPPACAMTLVLGGVVVIGGTLGHLVRRAWQDGSGAMSLHIKDLQVDYPGPLTALQGVDLEVAPAPFVCIVGPSGCGKTTLLRAVAGLEQPTVGTIKHHDGTPFSTCPQNGVRPPWCSSPTRCSPR